MKIIKVKTLKEYEILIGSHILHTLGQEIKKRVSTCKIAIITDDTVGKLYEKQVIDTVEEAGFTTCSFQFPHGEQSKHLRTIEEILEFLVEEELTRKDIILALGGGVAGDMAGFAAGIYLRGIDFIQVPTTFLAAVDSSVGGKTGVDLKSGKNLAGVFHQPIFVFCDTKILATLPQEIFLEGVAEVIKYGIIGDENLFKAMAQGIEQTNLEEIIATCVSMKRDIVMEDEFDTGQRQLLNLGHTLGHSIEQLSDFTIPHGHGVAIGMHLIAKMAEEIGLAQVGLAKEIKMALEKNHLPTDTIFSPKEIAKGTMKDKKRRGTEISFIFPEKIGKCCIKKIPVEDVENLIICSMNGR